jgi:hypothetical protein
MPQAKKKKMIIFYLITVFINNVNKLKTISKYVFPFLFNAFKKIIIIFFLYLLDFIFKTLMGIDLGLNNNIYANSDSDDSDSDSEINTDYNNSVESRTVVESETTLVGTDASERSDRVQTGGSIETESNAQAQNTVPANSNQPGAEQEDLHPVDNAQDFLLSISEEEAPSREEEIRAGADRLLNTEEALGEEVHIEDGKEKLREVYEKKGAAYRAIFDNYEPTQFLKEEFDHDNNEDRKLESDIEQGLDIGPCITSDPIENSNSENENKELADNNNSNSNSNSNSAPSGTNSSNNDSNSAPEK